VKGRPHAIRECAAHIMTALQTGIEPNLKAFTPAIQRCAWRLLLFEGLISRTQGYALTATGKRHVERHGPVVYPPREKA